MNWTQLQCNWERLQNVLQSRWPKLTRDDLAQIDGDRTVLQSKLQKHYGFPSGIAEQQICEFEKDVRFPGAVK